MGKSLSHRSIYFFPHFPSRVHPSYRTITTSVRCVLYVRVQKSRNNEAIVLHLEKIQTATHHEVTHRSSFVSSIGGDDDVDWLNNTLESLVKVFRFKLQL